MLSAPFEFTFLRGDATYSLWLRDAVPKRRIPFVPEPVELFPHCAQAAVHLFLPDRRLLLQDRLPRFDLSVGKGVIQPTGHEHRVCSRRNRIAQIEGTKPIVQAVSVYSVAVSIKFFQPTIDLLDVHTELKIQVAHFPYV